MRYKVINNMVRTDKCMVPLGSKNGKTRLGSDELQSNEQYGTNREVYGTTR